MLKKQTQALIYVIVLFFLFMLQGCTSENKTEQNHCLLDKSQCLVIGDENIQIRFLSDFIVAEQPVLFSVTTKKSIAQIWLEGVNMNMGKIPLVIEATDNGYSGVLFLGLCAQPTMVWLLNIEYTDGSQAQLNLTSYWQRPAKD